MHLCACVNGRIDTYMHRREDTVIITVASYKGGVGKPQPRNYPCKSQIILRADHHCY